MEKIKRFINGGYVRTAEGEFGTIVSAGGKYVVIWTTSGKLRTILKGDAFKSSRQEVEQHKAEAAVK